MAEGIAFSVVGKLAEYTVDPVFRQIKYLFFYDRNIQNLRDKVKDLENRRNDVELHVNATERNAEIIGENVSTWLEKVDELKENANEVLKGVASSEMRCLFNRRPNLKSRYILSRKLAKMTIAADKLKVEGTFERLNLTSYEGFETRLSIKKKIKKALKDKDIGIIGICGMPGIGKTTMAGKIVNEVKVEKLFEEVAFAVVSNNPDINKIQDQLAEALGLTIDVKTTSVRAGRLRQRLAGNDGKGILVILDDLWNEIDLGSIGIPSPHDCKGLKIMFTTRIEETCRKMGAQRKFEIEILDEEEGWQLFKDTAGISDDETDAELVSIAKKVADECGRLPLKLVVVGKALKGNKTVCAWRNAFEQLRSSTINPEGMENRVHKSIRLTYDNLANEEQGLLLLCSLSAEGESIPIENLVSYARGLELFKETETLYETRVRAKTITNKLEGCYLLQPGETEDEVKLHDVIRNFCLRMAYEDKRGYLMNHADLKEWPEHDADESCSAISITLDKSGQLPGGLKYHNVKLLRVICREMGECIISEDFFKGMEELRVLELGGMYIQIPSSIELLTGLQTLCLNNCKIHSQLSMIGSLKKLEILSFNHSSIGDYFPIELVNLSNLRSLILSNGDLAYLIDATNTIPNGIFGKLESLELKYLPKLIEICNGNLPRVVLKPPLFLNLLIVKMYDCDSIRSLFWESVAKCLVNLQSLDIYKCEMLEEVVSTDAQENEVTITCKMVEFPKLKKISFENLRRFKSFTSQANSSDDSQTLFNQVNFPNMEELNVRELDCIVKLLGKEIPIKSLHKLKQMVVRHCYKLLTIAESDSIQLLQNLKDLDVWKCDALEVLFDFEGINVTNDDAKISVLGRLRSLSLDSLPKLVHITRMVPKGICVFQNLTKLTVLHCKRLRYLFSPSIVISLAALENLSIDSCKALEEIIGREEKEEENTSETRNIVMDANTPSNLHHFTQVVSMDAKRNEVIEMLEFPKLNTLVLRNLISFKRFRSESNNDGILRTLFNQVTLPNMENLTSIVVERCGIFKYLFLPSMANSLVALRVLEVSNCKSIKAIVGKEEEEEEEEEEGTSEIKIVEVMKISIAFPKLDRLLLKNLSSIEMFCSQNCELVFPLLKDFTLENCPMMAKLSPWLVSAPKLDISNDGFKSRLSIKKKIKKALKDKDIGIIGVCGMPGIGKTTMAEEIVNEVKVEKLFEKVAFAVVSNDPDINKIQDQLAEVLGLNIEEKTTSERARQLRKKLSKDGKNILVILDDVWNEIDLGSIGIPSPHNCRGLKIMFTTRIEKTCSEMEAQRKFEIKVLNKEEGWQIFKDTAGISDGETDVDLVSMAKNVADECRGLPLALVVVGKALKGNKTVNKWEDALQQLQESSATNLEGIDNIVYKSARLGYNYLVSNEERGLLLLCSLFAEDESIPIENLVRYARGLELFKGTETLYETIDRSYSIVDNLKSSNLLQPGKKKDEVKLYDVIRDFCLHMAYEDKRGYLVNHAGLKEWPEDDADESYNAISITLDKSGQLPGGLKYQNVELLRVICRELGECTISEEFFKDMKELRVLELEGMYIQIPSSIQLLMGLQTLYLIDCKIHSQLSMIGSLKKLEVLSFYHSYFGDYFPIEFELANLSNLRSLDLRFRELSYPLLPGVLSGMKKLEELYLGRYIPIEGEDQRCIIEELCSLTSLRTFQISTHDTQILVQIFTELCLENLKRFHIDEVKVLRNSELDGDGFFKLRTPTLSRSDFKYLIDAANSIPKGTFDELESLELKGLPNLVEIGNGDLPRGVFKPPLSFNLKTIKMYDCDAIRSLFRESVAKCLVNLQSLDIYKCAMLEEVVSTDAQENEVTITCKMLELPKLKKISFETLRRFKSFTTQANSSDDSQTLFNQVYFPNMEELTVDRLDCLVKLLGKEMLITFGKLESLELKGLPNLVEIGNGDLPRGVFKPPLSFNLKNVKMYDCDAIRSLFRESVAKCLVNLQSLDIYKCAMLEEVVSTDAQENEVTITCKMLELPKLKKISFENLRRFKSFFTTQANSSDDSQTLFNQVDFPNMEELTVDHLDCLVKLLGKEMLIKSLDKLKDMELSDCAKLQSIAESDSIQLLKNLEVLNVVRCNALKVLFDFEGIKVTNDDVEINMLGQLTRLWMFSLPKLVNITRMVPKGIRVFQNLTKLVVLNCGSLRYLFSPSMANSLVALRVLHVSDCKSIEEIVGKEEEEGTSEDKIVEGMKTRIVFPELCNLLLVNLPSIQIFCSQNSELVFPSMTTLIIRRCPKMKKFSPQQMNAPELSKFERECVILPPDLLDVAGLLYQESEPVLQ